MEKNLLRQTSMLLLSLICLNSSAQTEADLRIRYHDFWWVLGQEHEILAGRQFYQTADGHLHYKGLMPTNREEGTFINFFFDGTTTVLGPDQSQCEYKVGESGEVYIIEIAENVAYEVHEISAGSVLDKDRYGFVLPLPEEYRNAGLPSFVASFIDVELWKDAEDKYWMKANSLPAVKRRLYVCGEIEVDGETQYWKREDTLPEEKHSYLTETFPGSLVFQGRVKAVDGGTFCLFAPRYPLLDAGGESRYDWQEQRLGFRTAAANGTCNLMEDEWTTEGMYLNEVRRWTLPQGEWIVTVDFRFKYFHNNTWGNTQPQIKFNSLAHSVDVGPAGWATFAPKMNVSPAHTVSVTTTGEQLDAQVAKVYYVTDRNDENYVLTIPEVKTTIDTNGAIAKGEGLLVEAPAGTTVTFNYTFNTPQPLYENWLAGVVETTSHPSDANYAYYVLGKLGEDVKFFRWKTGDLAPYKSYLRVPVNAGIPEFFSFGSEATVIDGVNESREQEGGEIYNISGQRITRPQRGVNIIGCKKIIF